MRKVQATLIFFQLVDMLTIVRDEKGGGRLGLHNSVRVLGALGWARPYFSCWKTVEPSLRMPSAHRRPLLPTVCPSAFDSASLLNL